MMFAYFKKLIIYNAVDDKALAILCNNTNASIKKIYAMYYNSSISHNTVKNNVKKHKTVNHLKYQKYLKTKIQKILLKYKNDLKTCVLFLVCI